MRTTVTLDDDVAIRLERSRVERGLTFKDALNEAVRLGLSALEEDPARAQPQVIITHPLPLGRRLVDVDSVAGALAIAEQEEFR